MTGIQMLNALRYLLVCYAGIAIGIGLGRIFFPATGG